MRTDKPEQKLQPMEEAMRPALEALIAKLEDLNGDACAKFSVHLWMPGPQDAWKVGVRVAEVSYSLPDGRGGAWMQVDPDCAQLLFACERFLITFGDEPVLSPGMSEPMDFHAEAVWALEQAWNKS